MHQSTTTHCAVFQRRQQHHAKQTEFHQMPASYHILGQLGRQDMMLPEDSSPEHQQAGWLALLLHPPLWFELSPQRVSLDGTPVLLCTTISFLAPITH
jgi:hypothetical protein